MQSQAICCRYLDEFYRHARSACRSRFGRPAAQLREHLKHAVEVREPRAIAVDEFVQHELALGEMFLVLRDLLGQPTQELRLHVAQCLGGVPASGVDRRERGRDARASGRRTRIGGVLLAILAIGFPAALYVIVRRLAESL